MQLEDKVELKNRVRLAAELIAQGEDKRSVEEALNQCVLFFFIFRMLLLTSINTLEFALALSVVSPRTPMGTTLARRMSSVSSHL